MKLASKLIFYFVSLLVFSIINHHFTVIVENEHVLDKFYGGQANHYRNKI